MKRILIIPVLFSLLAFMSSCTQTKYEVVAKQINSQCPISMGMVGDFTGMEFDDGNIVFNYSINEDFVNIESLNQNPELMKNSLEAMIKNPNQEFKVFLELIQEDKIGMTMRFQGKDTDKEAMLTLDYDELVKVMNANTTPDELLRAQIEQTNASCPITIETGMVMTHMEIEGDYAVYCYSIDEDLISISLLNENQEILKESIIQSLKADINDPSIKAFLYACDKAGKGIAYKYIGDTSGEEFLITVGLSEIGYM